MEDTWHNKIQSFAFVISSLAAFCLALCFASNLSNNTASAANINTLDNKINPNIAAMESLIRLPDIGISRAEMIIQYRENYKNENNNQVAFKKPEDLENIKGIGKKTVQNMSQWLEFE